MRSRSLQRQTLLAFLAAQLICAMTLCTAALLHEQATRLHSLDTQLQGRSDSLLGAVQDAEDPDDNVTIDPAELALPSSDIFAVYNQGGRLIGSSTTPPGSVIAQDKQGFRTLRTSQHSYRVLQRDAMRIIDRAENGGVGLRRPVTIIYAIPEDHLRHEAFEAAGFYIATILLIIGLVSLLLLYLLRRTFRPLEELVEATAKIRPPLFAFQAPHSALGTEELSRLADVLNRSIARVRESFRREQVFVADAAHELKTAVAVIRSSVQLLLLKRRSDVEYAFGLDAIVSDVDRLESLVAQMLQLAREEEEKPLGDLPVLDLTEAVSTVVRRMLPIAQERKLVIHVDAEAHLYIRLRADSAEKLVSNLLLNALQHTPQAGPPVTIRLNRNETGSVCLSVTDHGEGISQEALPHIFERFYREDKSRARSTGGVGLGLAIARSIVDSALGSIDVSSTQGAGTIITVTFIPA